MCSDHTAEQQVQQRSLHTVVVSRAELKWVERGIPAKLHIIQRLWMLFLCRSKTASINPIISPFAQTRGTCCRSLSIAVHSSTFFVLLLSLGLHLLPCQTMFSHVLEKVLSVVENTLTLRYGASHEAG